MPTTSEVPPELTAIGPKVVAKMLGISVRHLNAIRGDDPSFPPARMCGSLPRWHPLDILEWLRKPASIDRPNRGGNARGSAVRV